MIIIEINWYSSIYLVPSGCWQKWLYNFRFFVSFSKFYLFCYLSYLLFCQPFMQASYAPFSSVLLVLNTFCKCQIFRATSSSSGLLEISSISSWCVKNKDTSTLFFLKHCQLLTCSVYSQHLSLDSLFSVALSSSSMTLPSIHCYIVRIILSNSSLLFSLFLRKILNCLTFWRNPNAPLYFRVILSVLC